MKIALLRVGIDTGSGGIHGPIFADSSFEYIPIPDGRNIDPRTYGNKYGKHGRPLVDYFPPSRRERMANQSIHFDPEFETFTYGDPTTPKASLSRLEAGDMLVFYCGLQGWGFSAPPALYLMGFFEVSTAGRAAEMGDNSVHRDFSANFHVKHPSVYARDRDRNLVLVKGGLGSRLLKKAVLISSVGHDRKGRELKVISPQMRKVFGDFEGHHSLQRSPPRWVNRDSVRRAAEFVRSLH